MTAAARFSLLPQGPVLVGEGRWSAYIAVAFGALSLMGVLAFAYPSVLTTPALRASYDIPLLRGLIAAGLAVSAVFGSVGLLKGKKPGVALAGLGLSAFAMAFGGPAVAIGPIHESPFTIGLDWLAIGFLTTGGLFLLIEKAFPLRREQPIFRKDWLLDLKHFVFFHLLVSGFLFLTNAIVRDVLDWMIVPEIGDAVASLPGWVQFFLILAAVDFLQYWAHRLYHETDFFWRIHSVHHSAETMDWLASSRLNILEPLITRTLGLFAITALGFEEGPVQAYIAFIGFHATFIHANCRFDFGPLDWIFVTPKHHHWHHAKAEEAVNTNYAVHLSFLDRMFGTLHLPKAWPEAYGVVDGEPPTGLIKQQLHPFMGR